MIPYLQSFNCEDIFQMIDSYIHTEYQFMYPLPKHVRINTTNESELKLEIMNS